MKKFSVTIAAVTREVNANEYSVNPKTGQFEATVAGASAPAWTTSGKGKSAINNHYIYFKDVGQLYYFKSNATEVLEARKGLVVSLPGAVEVTPVETADAVAAKVEREAEVVEAPSAPAPKRTRSRK